MNDEQIKRIFHEALEKSPDARREFLDRICGEAGPARERIESLLRAHDEVGSFLDEPERGETLGVGEGDVVDRYKLLQQIGEGGFGLVFMAEQTEPVRRKVALKIIKLGMDTRHVIARFEAERQALALMDHPNIAKVLDAGATDEGRPYFVMELVKGVPITEYCDQARLDTAARLELFQLVCGAVQHAHQKGVIHRDLKPSNILVTLHDGRPVPKVIDFGIAKAIDRPLTEKTLFTEFRQMVGTPEYMAPEQAEMSGLDIDTRADIYSLGVLLYELLTGKKPFEMATLLQQGYDEVLRTIREVDPPKPSTRVSSMGDELATVANCRHTAPKLLGRLLRGDLDWIVMKALDKDRTRRYETASGLALDIGRFLANDAVHASPPSAAYRARKFVRRHRVGVIAGSVVAAALCAGLGIATAGFLEAREERDRARTEAKRANTVSALLESIFESWNPDYPKGANHPARALLDEFDLRYRDGLSDDPEVEAQMRRVIGTAYRSLGVADRAEPHLRAAYRLGCELYGEDSPFVAENRHAWGLLLQDRGDYLGAERAFRDLVARLDGVDANRGWRAEVRRSLARVLESQGRFDESEVEARRALELAVEPADRAAARSTLAWTLHSKGDNQQAEALLRDALAWNLESRGENHPATCFTRNQLAFVVQQRNRYDEAEALYRKALAGSEHSYGRPDEAVLSNLAYLLAVRGRYEESARLCSQALENARSRLGPTHRFTALLLVDVADVHKRRKDFKAAKVAYEEAIEILRSTAGEETLDFADALRGLAQILEALGDYEEAARAHRDVLRLRRQYYGEEHAAISTALHNLACTQEKLGDLDGAIANARAAVALSERLASENKVGLSTQLNSLGVFLMHKREFDESERVHQRALNLRIEHLGEDHEYVATSLANLAVLLHARATAQQGDEAFLVARRAYEKALAASRRVNGDDHIDVANIRMNFGTLEIASRNFDAAEAHLQKALAVRREKLAPDHPDVAAVLFHLGNMYALARDYPAGRARLEEALSIRRARLGEGHPETCRTRLWLGVIELGVGRFELAATAFREAIDGFVAAGHGSDRGVVVASLALGVVYQCTGKRDEGRELITRTLAGAQDRSTAACDLDWLAQMIGAQQRMADAERVSRLGLEFVRSEYGEDDLATAGHYLTLALVLANLGKGEEAERCARRCLEIRRATYGEKHSAVVAALGTLANTLFAQGKNDEAEKCIREGIAIERDEETVGVEQGAQLYASLATLLRSKGDLDGAERNLRRALELYREEFGPECPQQAGPLREFASLLEQRGAYEEAAKMQREVLAIVEKALGPKHFESIDAKVGLARILTSAGRPAEAVPLLEDALARLEAILEPASPQLLWTRLFLARAHRAAKAPEKAEPLLAGIAAGLREHHGIENRLYVDTARELAGIYHGADRLREAEAIRKEYIPLMRKLEFPPLVIAADLAGHCWILLRLRKFQEAEPVSREVLAVRDKHLPDGHWLRASARCLLGRSLAGQRRFAEAEPLITEGYESMKPPPNGVKARRETLEAIIEMYVEWKKPAKAGEWRAKREG